MEEQKKNITKEVVSKQISKKIPPKTKLIILCIGALSFLLFFFPIVIITPILVYYDADDIDLSGISIGGTYSYTKISTTTTFMWPIGSDETEEKDGVLYATGEPIPYKISSGFGLRNDPGGSGEQTDHGGLDIAPISSNGYGTVNIIASKDGKVTYSTGTSSSNCPSNEDVEDGCGGGYGNYVMIEHSDGTTTVYAHMYENSITVNTGDTVKAGQVIGTMGSSGQSEAMHLHFEVRVNGERVDPLNYISEENTRPTTPTYTISNSGVDGTDASQVKQAICLSLLESGFSKPGIAGALRNFAGEGVFRTNNMEDAYETGGEFRTDESYTSGVDNGSYSRDSFVNDAIGYGLAQWTYDKRKAGLYDFAKSSNTSIADFDMQLNFFYKEIRSGSFQRTVSILTDETVSAYDAANIYCLEYENPANATNSCKARASGVQEYYDYVLNGCQ